MDYRINLGSPFWHFDREQVKRIEPDAVYLADLALKTKGVNGYWTRTPAAVFYTPTPRIGYTNKYFGVLQRAKFEEVLLPKIDYVSRAPEWVICDATSVTEHEWIGLERNGEVVFSRWVHDFRTFEDGGPYVDGGPEYTRIVYDYEELQQCNDVKLKIVDGKFEVTVSKQRTPL